MNILILCPSISGSGGLQRVVINWANYFISNHKITIGTLEHKTKNYYKIDEKINVEYLGKCRYKPYQIFSGLLRKLSLNGKIKISYAKKEKIFYPTYRLNAYYNYICSGKYNIVIAIGMDMSIILSMLKSKLPDTIMVGWEHNTFDAYFEEKGRYSYGLKEIVQNSLSTLDKLIVLTKYDEKQYKEIIKAPVFTISNPLSFLTDKVSDITNHKLLFVGRLDIKSKGIDILLRIVSIVLSEFNNWELIIVGDGERKKIKTMIAKMGLDKQVKMVGEIKNTSKYYISSSILLSTSRWEGFGLVITEAMECGLPVVAFDNLGPSEIITNGKDGFLIPRYNEQEFAEKLILLMENINLRETMSKAAIKKAQLYYPDKIYKRWSEILQI